MGIILIDTKRWNPNYYFRLKNFQFLVWVQSTCTLLIGMGDDTMHASSVLAMPMVSSKITGFRGVGGEHRSKLSLRSPSGWGRIPVEDETVNMLDTTSSEED